MWTHRIEFNPNVMQGKPVVKGTRIPVELVLRKLGEGATMDDLHDAYPRLRPEDVCACLAYAAERPYGSTVDWQAEAHRQSLAVARSPQAEEDQKFVEAISVWDEM